MILPSKLSRQLVMVQSCTLMESEQMEYIVVNVPKTEMLVESRGVKVEVELNKIPVELLSQMVLHGVKQKVSDSASGAALAAWKDIKGEDAPKPSRDQMSEFADGGGKAKIAFHTQSMMDKAVAALYAGQWQVREAGGTSSKWNDVQALALSKAKDVLTARFKSACEAKKIKKTIESFSTLLGPKVAEFFGEKAKKAVWNDDRVMEYVLAQKDTPNGRDFLQEAQDEIAANLALVPDDAGSFDDL